MFCVLVSGAEETAWRRCALRLREVTLLADRDAPPEAYDAAVFVGPVPPDAAVIERFLSTKKHVLLATDTWLSAEVLAMLSAAAQRGGVQFAVANADHHLPSLQLVRQQLDAGRLGAPGFVRLHRWQAAAVGDRCERGEVPGRVVRDLELVVWLMGRPAERVYAVESKVNAGQALGGRYVQVHLGFPGGGMALIDHSDRLPPGDGYFSLTLVGSAGAAYSDDHQNMQLVYRGGQPQAVRTDEGTEGLTTLLRDFVEAVRTGRDLAAGLAAWRHVGAIVAAVRRSIDSGRAVELEGR
jgi:predicted dehydrogenase